MPVLAQENTKDISDFPVLTGPYLGQKPPGKTSLRFKPEGFKRDRYAEPVFLFSSVTCKAKKTKTTRIKCLPKEIESQRTLHTFANRTG